MSRNVMPSDFHTRPTNCSPNVAGLVTVADISQRTATPLSFVQKPSGFNTRSGHFTNPFAEYPLMAPTLRTGRG